MIVDHTNIDEEIVVPQMAALEADLFGRGAWSEQSIRQEFRAPARTYLFDIDDCGIVDCAAAAGPVVNESAAADTTEKQPVVRGYAGFWYDGDDAEIMTIGRQAVSTAGNRGFVDGSVDCAGARTGSATHVA